MKKLMTLAIASGMLALVGCGGGTKESTAGGTTPATATTPAPDAGAAATPAPAEGAAPTATPPTQ
jgi:hypothetical protein